MTDWASVAISAAAGLAGAGVGGRATLKVGREASANAQQLADQERTAEEVGRKRERSQAAAMGVRTVITSALTNFDNLGRLEALRKGRQLNDENATRLAAAAKDAVDAVRQAWLLQGYLLSDDVQLRLQNLLRLMTRATYGELKDEKVGPDVQTYGRYVRLSLQAVVHDQEVPAHTDPPDLGDPDRPLWSPTPIPVGWDDLELY